MRNPLIKYTNMKNVIITFVVCIFLWGLLMIPTGLKIGYILPIALCAGGITSAFLLLTIALCKMASENEKEEQTNIIDKKNRIIQ